MSEPPHYFELPSGMRVFLVSREPSVVFEVKDQRGRLLRFTADDVKALPFTAGALYGATDERFQGSHSCPVPGDDAGSVVVWRCPECRALWDHHDYPAPNGGVTPQHWARRE